MGFFSYLIFAGCSTINVNLCCVVNNTYGFLNGNYTKEPLNVNGKPSWNNDVNAIWYIQSDNNWLIGPLSEIGNNTAYIFASNDFSGITDNDNQWLYWNGTAWTSPFDPNDIKITCLDGKY